jgi:hypothetical protein
MPLVLIKPDQRAREKPCLRCGYSLRKILDSRNCPECGLSIWISLNNNDALDWSRPDWLRLLSLGALIMAAAQALGIIATVVLLMPWWLGSMLSAIVIATYFLALGAGMLLLAAPEHRYPDELRGYRWSLIAAAIVGALFGLGLIAAANMGRLAFFRYSDWMQIVMLFGAVTTLLYLRKLARRMGAPRLARLLAWLLILPALKFLQLSPYWGFRFAYRFLRINDVLPALFIPISLVILIYLAFAFRKSARAAEANWASAG